MLQERRNQIIKKIKTTRTIKVVDLVNEYQVSIETIRRDLEYLEKAGYLRRVYGGAVLEGLYGEEPDFANREIINFHEKLAIGKRAAELIEDGDTIFVDVGTTVLEVVQNFGDKKDLTVITNATLIAHQIVKYDKFRVILLGGELRRGELSVAGPICEEELSRFYANKMLMGVGGISLWSGVTDYHFSEANIRRLMLERSSKVIAIADYSKFGVTAMNAICPISKIDKLVTDWTVPKKTISEFSDAGIDIIVAYE